MRFTEKFWNGRWWPREEWDAMVAAQRAKALAGRKVAAPMIISDKLDDVLNPVNGRLYDSVTMNEIGNHPRPRTRFYWEMDDYKGIDWNSSWSGQ